MRYRRSPFLLLIVLTSALIGAMQLTHGHDWGDDFAGYIMQAQSILNGDLHSFVEHNRFTIEQSSNQIGPIAYPWGYPLVLVPFYAMRGISPMLLKIPNLFALAGFVTCFYFLMCQRLSLRESLLLTSVVAFNPFLLKFLDHILSDILFLCISTLALLLMSQPAPHTRLRAVLLGCIFAVAVFIRTTGILLLGSFLVVEGLRLWDGRSNSLERNLTIKRLTLVILSFIILWIVYTFIFPDGSQSYLNQLGDFNLGGSLTSFFDYTLAFQSFFDTYRLGVGIFHLALGCLIVGLWQRSKLEPKLSLFFGLWMLSLMLWPVWQGARFLIPIFPLFIYFAFQGMKTILSYVFAAHPKISTRGLLSIWLFIAGLFLISSVQAGVANLQGKRTVNGPFDPYSLEMYNFIQEQTSPESKIVFFKPRAMRLMTGHDSLLSTDCERLSLGDFIVLSKKVEENQQVPPEQIESCHLPLEVVFTNRRFIVYQFLH